MNKLSLAEIKQIFYGTQNLQERLIPKANLDKILTSKTTLTTTFWQGGYAATIDPVCRI